MPSWQSYFIQPVLWFQVKLRLILSNSAHEAREAFNHHPPVPHGAHFTAATLGGVPGEWAEAAGEAAATLLYLHGGGYCACSPQTHRSITGAYAIRGFKVFAPEYRLAPEHLFPAAVEDALAAYKALLETTPPGQLLIGGDSAGGGLALATLLAAKAQGLPMPAAAMLFSPWTDLAITGDSIRTNAGHDNLLHAPKIAEGAAIYLHQSDPKNPLASPLYGDPAGLPPLLFQASADEILRDDSTRMAEHARAAGVRVEITIWPNMPHVWQAIGFFLPEARQALDQAAAFGKAALASGAAGA
jgi:acetyl esterase/lipase